MSKPKYFAVERTDDIFVISPHGSIGALDELLVRVDWDGVLSQLETANVTRAAVVDLASLDYFGSIMLELLVVLWKRLSSKGGRLALCNVSPVGLEILRVARFDTVWPIVPGVQDAMDAVRN